MSADSSTKKCYHSIFLLLGHDMCLISPVDSRVVYDIQGTGAAAPPCPHGYANDNVSFLVILYSHYLINLGSFSDCKSEFTNLGTETIQRLWDNIQSDVFKLPNFHFILTEKCANFSHITHGIRSNDSHIAMFIKATKQSPHFAGCSF